MCTLNSWSKCVLSQYRFRFKCVMRCGGRNYIVPVAKMTLSPPPLHDRAAMKIRANLKLRSGPLKIRASFQGHPIPASQTAQSMRKEYGSPFLPPFPLLPAKSEDSCRAPNESRECFHTLPVHCCVEHKRVFEYVPVVRIRTGTRTQGMHCTAVPALVLFFYLNRMLSLVILQIRTFGHAAWSL